MKTKSLVLLFTILMAANHTYGQFSFGVSPGIGLNTAYFGYNINDKVVPFIGFQYVNASVSYEESGQFGGSSETSVSLSIPNIGVKYFFVEQDNLRAYGTLSLTKPFITGSAKFDGQTDDDFEETLSDIQLWGGELGFGVEYFFDDNFSIGGEFGLRYLNLNGEQTYVEYVYDPNLGNVPEEREREFNVALSPTYSKVSLNFYF